MNSALILTAAMDNESFERFDALRVQHFPPERNFIPAHITLFHALPVSQQEKIFDIVQLLCNRTATIEGSAKKLRKLGAGVAYDIEAPQLVALHGMLKDTFGGAVSGQDRLPFQPHVTIQNKVDPAVARALFESMQAEHKPFPVDIVGIELWLYMGGPWQHVARIDFLGITEPPPG